MARVKFPKKRRTVRRMSQEERQEPCGDCGHARWLHAYGTRYCRETLPTGFGARRCRCERWLRKNDAP